MLPLPTLDQFSVAARSLHGPLSAIVQHNCFLNSKLAILTLSPFNFTLFLFLHLDFYSQSTCT